MKRTIVYFGNTCYPDKDASAQRTIGNGKALRELGYDVIFVGCKEGEKRDILDTCEQFCGFNVYYYEEPKSLHQWKDYLIGFEPLKKILVKNKAEAVVLYNHPSISTKRILSFCHKKGIKVYADCTEWYDPKGFSFHTAIKKADTWYRMKHVNRRLDGIIAISSFLQNYYRNKGCETICVPPLIDLKDTKWRALEPVSEQSNKIKLVYVGSPGAGTKDKLGLILIALNDVKSKQPEIDFSIDIIGIDAGQFQVVFKEDPSKYDFVTFHGRMPNIEALGFLKRADYTIFLRDNNLICTAGFPTKFSESIACGTPVLTNITSDLGAYLLDGKNGFTLDISSLSDLGESICNALSVSREQINNMKEWCRKERTFDYHSFVDEFSKMF